MSADHSGRPIVCVRTLRAFHFFCGRFCSLLRGLEVGVFSLPGGRLHALALHLGRFALSLSLAPRGKPGIHGLGQLRN